MYQLDKRVECPVWKCGTFYAEFYRAHPKIIEYCDKRLFTRSNSRARRRCNTSIKHALQAVLDACGEGVKLIAGYE